MRLPAAIMYTVSGFVLWMVFARAAGFKDAGEIFLATLLIVVGVLARHHKAIQHKAFP